LILFGGELFKSVEFFSLIHQAIFFDVWSIE